VDLECGDALGCIVACVFKNMSCPRLAIPFRLSVTMRLRVVPALPLIVFICLISWAKMGAAVDQAMIGTWQIRGETEHQPWKLTWVIRPDNSYYFEGLFSDAGRIAAGGGKWHIVSSVTGQRSDGTYSFPDPNHLQGTGPLGPGTWTRVGAAQGDAGKPTATPADLPHEEEQAMMNDFLNASHNKESRDRLEAKARSGIPQAQTVFGLELESEKKFSEAVTWYRKAAAQNEANAMRNLGVCYLDGKGITKQPAEAANWFRKAADLGNQDAPDDLGDLYLDGIGVTKDEAAAAGWYRKGAERGDGNAMNSLAACYWRGQGIAKSPRDAIVWWKKAAGAGNDNAKKNLQMALGKFDEAGQPRTPAAAD
jgi:hypothetical protein